MALTEWLRLLLHATDWQMQPPAPCSAFHLLLTTAGVFTAWFLARVLGHRARKSESPVSTVGRTLSVCGLLLVLMELYKQAFLFFIVNDRHFDWWYFPFQLCSIPMYLCLLPFLPGWKQYASVCTSFLQDFGILGGIMALAVPPGLMHPYWTLTLHGFIWHFILIFIGLFCAISGTSDLCRRGFLRTLPLYFLCCLTALAINTAAGPAAGAEMFYISPFRPSGQPFFHQISVTLGIFPGIMIYIAAMLLGAALVHSIIQHALSQASSAT